MLHAIDPQRFDSLTDDEQFDALHDLSGVAIPQAIEEIRHAEVRQKDVVDINGMEGLVRRILGI